MDEERARNARLLYLNSAAAALTSSSPVIAADINRDLGEVAHSQPQTSSGKAASAKARNLQIYIQDTSFLNICAACGFSMFAIPSTIVRSRERPQHNVRRRPNKKQSSPPRVEVQCPRCDALAYKTLEEKPPRRKKSTVMPRLLNSSGVSLTEDSKAEPVSLTQPPNSSPKNRPSVGTTEARKRQRQNAKKRNLSSMLAKSKADAAAAANSQTFDLLDFMKGV